MVKIRPGMGLHVKRLLCLNFRVVVVVISTDRLYVHSPHWLQSDAPNSPPKLPFPFDDHHPI